jgi:hypothetical protein
MNAAVETTQFANPNAYEGPDENTIFEKGGLKIVEVRRVHRQGASFVEEPGEHFAAHFRHPTPSGSYDIKIDLPFERVFGGSLLCPGLTDESIAALLMHRLDRKLKQDGVSDVTKTNIKHALFALEVLAKVG